MQRTILATLVLALATGDVDAQRPTPQWLRVTEAAPWQPRDSQGEVAYRDQLWIFRRVVQFVRRPTPRRVEFGRRQSLAEGHRRGALETQRPADVAGLRRQDVDHGGLVQRPAEGAFGQ